MLLGHLLRHSDSVRKILMLTRYGHQECGQYKDKMISVSKTLYNISNGTSGKGFVPSIRPRGTPWIATQETNLDQCNVPGSYIILPELPRERKCNSVSGIFFNIMSTGRSEGLLLYFFSFQAMGKLHTRQGNIASANEHNNDPKTHAQRSNIYHVNFLCILACIWGVVVHICTI